MVCYRLLMYIMAHYFKLPQARYRAHKQDAKAVLQTAAYRKSRRLPRAQASCIL